MKGIDILSVVPALLERSPFRIDAKGAKKGLLRVNVINLRRYSTPVAKQIDDYQFGGGTDSIDIVSRSYY